MKYYYSLFFIDIGTASEISCAILSEFIDNTDDSHTRYVILGVMQQLEKIKQANDNINKAMSGEIVA